MGKTPKKAAPGGDERNLNVRRIKATTAPSKTSESNLPERQRESENSNRQRLGGIQKKVLPSSTKRLKSKLHSPANFTTSPRTKTMFNVLNTIIKEDKVQGTLQHLQLIKQKMQPKSEEAETNSSISTEKEEKEESVGNKKEEVATKDSNANHTTDEQDSTSSTSNEKKTVESIEEDASAQNDIKLQDKENDKKANSDENNKELEEQEQEELQLSLQVDDSPVKSRETTSTDSVVNDENESGLSQTQEVNDTTKEKKGSQSESDVGTESCSLDIVESVTSESSEVSEIASQQDTKKEKEQEKEDSEQTVNCDDVKKLTLKHVQIKLNDCLKESFKHVEVCATDNNTSSLSSSDSFGKTLRNISGRSAINRCRHASSDYRFPRYDTQLTNVSTLSSPRREATNVKILRYSTGLSDSTSSNGSPVDRKRKIEFPDSITTKKQKTEQSSLLNTSMDILRGLRKPIKISTPNVGYDVQSDKINIREIHDGNEKLLPTHAEGTKKWCAIM